MLSISKQLYSKKGGRRQNRSKGEEKSNVIQSGQLRAQKDFSELELPPNCTLVRNNDVNDLMNFTIKVTPDEGYWEGATYRFRFVLDEQYPHVPPRVTCEDLIYHPNIDLQGAVCLNILRDDWRPVLAIQDVVHGLIFLLLEPNSNDPLNSDAASVMRNNQTQFKRNVDSSLRGQRVGGVNFTRNPPSRSRY